MLKPEKSKNIESRDQIKLLRETGFVLIDASWMCMPIFA